MLPVIIISICICACLALLVIIKPNINIKGRSISIYWLAPLAGALVFLFAGFLTFSETIESITADTSVNPLKILVLFISVSLISVFLDETGFFAYLANAVLRRSGKSQKKLFLLFYLMVSLLTLFTSNDIVILTFTPFICYFAKNAGIDPKPYLIAEFAAANTWSMALIIGNPTNIYLASGAGIDFLNYMFVMALPAVAAGLVSFVVIWLLFRKKLKIQIEPQTESLALKNLPLCIIGLVHLLLCTLLLAISSYIGLEMWLITLCFAGSLIICAIIYSLIKRRKPSELSGSLRRCPWELIPFVLSMFVMVTALDKYGVTAEIAKLADSGNTVINFGFVSFLAANLMNNIPMSVLFGSVTQNLSGKTALAAVYSVSAGANLAAILTPLGALAGVMYMQILKKQKIKYSYLSFIGYGVLIAVPSLAAALAVIILML